MKHIQEYVCEIDEEIEGAKNYAEKAIYWKYEGNANRYKLYSQMSEQELDHTKNLHDMALEDINKLKERGYNAPEEMQAIWERSHKEYVEKVAWVRQMLLM